MLIFFPSLNAFVATFFTGNLLATPIEENFHMFEMPPFSVDNHSSLVSLHFYACKAQRVVSVGLFWFSFMSFSYNGVYFLWQTFSSA